MKPIFPKTIGTLRDLGTARVWIVEATCVVVLFAVLAVLLILA